MITEGTGHSTLERGKAGRVWPWSPGVHRRKMSQESHQQRGLHMGPDGKRSPGDGQPREEETYIGKLRRRFQNPWVRLALSFMGHQTSAKQIPLHNKRMAIIKQAENECWWGCGEIATLVHCCQEWKMMQLLQKTGLQFLKKITNVFTPQPEHIPKGSESRDLQRYLYTHVRSNLFTISKRWSTPSVHQQTTR